MQKPSLEASWSEHILSNPIKPRMFPHIAIPSARRSFDPLSQSLRPDSSLQTSTNSRKSQAFNKLSSSFANSSGFRLKKETTQCEPAEMHNNPSMVASVDRLFEEGEVVDGYMTSQQLQQVQQQHLKAEERFEKIDEENEKDNSKMINGDFEIGKPNTASPNRKNALDSLSGKNG